MIGLLSTSSLILSILSGDGDDGEGEALARFRMLYGLGDKIEAYKVLFDAYPGPVAHDLFRNLVLAESTRMQQGKSLEDLKASLDAVDELSVAWMKFIEIHIVYKPPNWCYTPSLRQLFRPNLNEIQWTPMIWEQGDRFPAMKAWVPFFADWKEISSGRAKFPGPRAGEERVRHWNSRRESTWSIDRERAMIYRMGFEILPLEDYFAWLNG